MAGVLDFLGGAAVDASTNFNRQRQMDRETAKSQAIAKYASDLSTTERMRQEAVTKEERMRQEGVAMAGDISSEQRDLMNYEQKLKLQKKYGAVKGGKDSMDSYRKAMVDLEQEYANGVMTEDAYNRAKVGINALWGVGKEEGKSGFGHIKRPGSGEPLPDDGGPGKPSDKAADKAADKHTQSALESAIAAATAKTSAQDKLAESIGAETTSTEERKSALERAAARVEKGPAEKPKAKVEETKEQKQAKTAGQILYDWENKTLGFSKRAKVRLLNQAEKLATSAVDKARIRRIRSSLK